MKWLDKLLGRNTVYKVSGNQPQRVSTVMPMESDLPELSESAKAELRAYFYMPPEPDGGDEKQGVP